MSKPINPENSQESMIPLVDLNTQFKEHESEFNDALKSCLNNSSFIGGENNKKFAKEFADWCGGGFVSLVGNGTDALIISILELLGKGDGSEEIITVSHTFISTAEAIVQAGYKPVFVDIDSNTYVMDVSKIESAISDKTRAIIPVHLYGQMVDMDGLMKIAESKDLIVIEDAAQAHGANWNGMPTGHWGHAACFSFYPGKNLGAWGDAGAVFSRDESLINRITSYANHGRKEKYLHEVIGINSRLDGLQASILRVKLKYLSDWNNKRVEIANYYNKLLKDHDEIVLPKVNENANHVYHLYVIQVDNRDKVLRFLNDNNVGAGIHYPVPLHKQPALNYLSPVDMDLLNTETISERIISLPIYPQMTFDLVERVVNTLLDAINHD